MEVGSLWVRIGVKLDELKSGLAAAQAEIKKVEKRFESFRAVGQRLVDIGQSMTLGITLPLAAAGGASIKFAMDAVESENLFTVSMGNMAEAARAWSEQLSASLGLNEYELRRNIGTWNVMFQSMGFGEQAAYQMAQGLTQLAYDMASFYNLKPEEAFEKLRSGIAGEIEPLRRLGILVDENTVKTYAYTHGIAKAGEELTETQKVAARYGAILEQTSKAQGDLARTIESPANQLRVLKARVQELLVDIGKQLIPVFSELVKHLKNAASWFSSLSETQKKALVVIAGIAAALGPLTMAIGAVIKGIGTWTTAVKSLTTVMNVLRVAILTNPIGLLITAIVAVGAAVAALAIAWKRDWGGIQEKTRAVGQAIVAIFSSVVTNIALAFNRLKEKIWSLLQGVLNALAPVANIIGKIAPGFETGFENLRKAVANKVADVKVNIADLQVKAADAGAQIQDAFAGVKDAFSSWETPAKQAGADIAEAANKAAMSYNALDAALVPAGEQFEKTGGKAKKAGKDAKEAAEDTRAAWERTADILSTRLQIIQAQQEIASIALGENASEADKLRLRLDYLNRQYEVQQQIVEHLRATYEAVVATKGEVAKETEETASKYAQEARTLAELAREIGETQLALQRMSWATEEVKARLEVLDAEQERALARLDEQAGKTAELTTKLHYLNEKLAVQRELVANLQRAYDAVAAAKGKDAEETRKAYLELVKAQTEEAKLQREIRDTNKAIQEQAEEFRKLTDRVSEIAKKYRDDLAKAAEDYQKKVEEVNRKLAEDERKLTEQYQAEVDKRAKSLRDFVGLFDEVKLKEVSGEQLLKNLRQQVEVFRQWQENLRALAARGVDEGLIAELREMGPKAAAEIAALNTLSDEQLAEYVALWRQKNADARAEAESQLTGLLAETQAKIAELRANAAAQLEQYRQEWLKKTQEIRENTVSELKKLVEEAAKQGTEMVTRLAAAITAALPQLSEALAGLPGFGPAAGAGTDQVKHAQEQKAGVVQAAQEQKAGVIEANATATMTVLQTWYEAGLQMAARHEEIKTKTLTTWQQIQQQLSALWARMLADVKKTWDDMRKYLFDVTKQVEERFTYLVNAANSWGVSLMSNFIAGIWSQFDRLRETLQAMAEMVDSYMPHSPAKRGPLSRIGEWGPAIVRELTEGIRRSMPSLEEVTARMAVLSPGALAPAIATSYNTSNAYYGGNTIYIQVSGGGNASDLADQLMRELRKRGVRL